MRAMRAIPASRFHPLMVILLIAAAALAAGCFEKETKPKPVVPAESVDDVIQNLKKSWNDLNYGAYQSLLSDDFTFAFAPQDIGGPNNNPETWGRADELLCASNLFGKTAANSDGYVAEGLTLQFVIGTETPNNMGSWTKVVLSGIFLTVRTRHKDTADPLDYLVQGDQANLWLTQDGNTWKIVRWEDKPVGAAPGTKTNTWGQIKGIFRNALPPSPERPIAR